MRFKPLIFFVFILLSLSVHASANNLTISNVSIEDRDSTLDTAVVEFDVSWDNSWRNTTNYDAVWVVLKVQASSTWYHGYLYAGGVDPAGSSPGSNEDLQIVIPTDYRVNTDYPGPVYLGAFIYRKSTGSGTVTSRNVRLKLDYATTAGVAGITIADTTSISVKVVGVEMVYIPQEPFYAGDTSSTATFKMGSGVTTPWYIDSEGTLNVGNAASGTFYYTTGGNTGESATGSAFTIPAVFPKGYGAFYCMKYEVTEGQWVDFFNSLNSSEKTLLDVTSIAGKNSDSVVKRNTIAWSTGDATTARSDRAMNYFSWLDLMTFLDWMSLRPMSELEYEKVARGSLTHVSGEYAWGSTSITAGVTFSGSPEDENITFSTANANANYNVTTFIQGDDFLGAQYVQGPVRAGIFATSSSTRTSSGAGYYGVMELSGNVEERVVTVGNTTGLTFYPTHGDGVLTGTGLAQQLGWPETPDTTGTDGLQSALGGGFKGGRWSQAATLLRVSDRANAALNDATRTNSYGGRGVRSATPATLPTCGNGSAEPPEQCDAGSMGSCTSCDDTTCTCIPAG